MAREVYEVIEEVLDPGRRGATFARSGMDRARDLVAAGVSVVLAQDRDLLVLSPSTHYLLRRGLEQYGCALRTLDDRINDIPEGRRRTCVSATTTASRLSKDGPTGDLAQHACPLGSRYPARRKPRKLLL